MLQDTLRFLIKLKDGQLKLSAALLSLEQAGVMEPWDELQELTGVQGLHRVCENKLKTLNDTGFVRMRWAGAISIAYTQLQSQRRVSSLQQRMKSAEQSQRTSQRDA